MFTFCFFRRRTERKKIADLEHIAIEPQTPMQPKPVLPTSKAFGTTVIGEYIPEDSISFVQHTNPPNPVDHSLESTIASSQIQDRFTEESSADLSQQFSASLPRSEDIRYDQVPSNYNTIQAARAAKTSDSIHQPIPSNHLCVAMNQLTEMANQDTIIFSPVRAAINHDLDMVTQQPQVSDPLPVAVDQLPCLANYQPTVAQPHHNIIEAIMDLSQPFVPIPQTPPPSEAARHRSLTDALWRLEGQSARPYSTTGCDWHNHRQLGSRDPSLSTVPKECDDDDVPLAELQERLHGRAQQAMYRQNGGQELRYRDADEAVEAAMQKRIAREEEAARQTAIRTANLPETARMATQVKAARQGQYRPRGALPNAQRKREAGVRHGLGTRDRGYDTEATEAAGQRLTAQDVRPGIEERQRQRQLQMRFYGGLPQDTYMVRGADDRHGLDTHGRPPPLDDFAAFQAAALQRERAAEQERELRGQIVESDEYRQQRAERTQRIRGEGVTDTRLTDFDVDAVNRQTANQPPRPRQMNAGVLDGSQRMPHAMPRPDLPDLPPRVHMRRADRKENLGRIERAGSILNSGSGEVPCQGQKVHGAG